MTTADEAWIQNSLARLETLEQQRAQMAATATPEQLAGLDEEIRTLYEVLEAVADGEDESAPQSAAPAPDPSAAAPQPQPEPHPFAAAPAATGSANPFGAPAPAPSATPFAAPNDAAPPVEAPVHDFGQAGFSSSYDGSDMDFDEPRRSKAPLVLGAVAAVLVLAGGGWYVSQSSASSPPSEEAPAPTKVIQAGEVPDNTQEPNVAQGGSADRTEGTRIRESSQPQRSRSRSSSTRRAPAEQRETKSEKRIEVGNTRDPLAGVR